MEFDLTAFTLSPTTEVFERCRKKDLVSIAEFFNIRVTREAAKQVIKKELYDRLVADGILAAEGASAEVFETEQVHPYDPRLEIRLRELELEIKKQECESQMIRLRVIDAEKERDIQLRKLDLEALKKPVPLPRSRPPSIATSPVLPVSSVLPSAVSAFDISKYVKLVPPFREAEVDAYFVAFERIAGKLNWPRDMWALLLQCSLVGKAQEVISALSLEDSLEYDIVKSTVLRAYELVPEAYRQRFRSHVKTSKQTYVEFGREKRALFEKWCMSSKIDTFEQLCELFLLEDFKKSIPEKVVQHLNEQKVITLAEAAVSADEFVLTHRKVFSQELPSSHFYSSGDKFISEESPSQNFSRSCKSVSRPKVNGRNTARQGDRRVCFYCLDPGHLISECREWNKKNAKTKSVALTQTLPGVREVEMSGYEPFILDGQVSISDSPVIQVSVLRDTGSFQSFVLESVLPFSDKSYTGTDVLVRGIEMGCVRVPLHEMELRTDLVSGIVKLAVCKQLPVAGVHIILGNDLAGGKVFSSPVVMHKPLVKEQPDLGVKFPSVFPACAVTRAQAQKFHDVVNLSDLFLNTESKTAESKSGEAHEVTETSLILEAPLSIGKEKLAVEQKLDPSLVECVKTAVKVKDRSDAKVGYFWENEVLMRKWKPRYDEQGLQETFQIVLPTTYRMPVLKLAHENIMAGHLGVTKTVRRISKYFFWPGLRSSVVNFCRSCDVCQRIGKPNQKVPVAPLYPIPVIEEPFERLIVDCVGPLPKSKSGHQYVLTIMCAATRFPEAIPLHSLKAKTVVKDLVKFFSTFGLPRIIQSDQGTNFTSKTFSQVLKELGVEHRVSSPYHPESQGALERFHQTLKTMIRAYCLQTGKDWAEGLPFLLFAARETVQESLGFSPAELVFGHTVRGPLKMMYEHLLTPNSSSVSLLDYVSSFRERLHKACAVAKTHLSVVQAKMKRQFDKKSVQRNLQVGDSVLVLLPVPGAALQAKFSGPYVIEKKLSETDYVVQTPDRRRKTRVCHVNMLKAYVVREPSSIDVPLVPSIVTITTSCAVENDVALISTPHLENSSILRDLSNYLRYLSEEQNEDVCRLIHSFPSLFSDVPSRTSVLCHDIEVGSASPVKQHPYRVNPRKRNIMKDEVKYLLKHGLAVPSQSPWSSPCLLVPKPDSTYRFCTDYRKVNNLSVPDSFPLPRIEDCIDRVGTARYVTKIDLLKGYWQVPLTPRASEISAFVTPDNFLQYTVLAFGMRNAPATFQRLMQKVLSDVPKCEAYIDDVVLYSDSWVEHMDNLELLFTRLSDASLTVNLAKCEFAKGEVTYLGKKVGQGSVRPVEAKVSAIIDYPSPSNKRELRRFLGMCGYYRNFCNNFSSVVTPLTDLLSDKRTFAWSSECEHAFVSAKDLLCYAPVLKAPEFHHPFKLHVDASSVGAGAVLLQEDNMGIDHPVCYFSKKFSKCQNNYSTIEKEALALVLALQHFEVYLGGSSVPIVVFTDHNPLTFLSRMCNANQRLMRWALIVQEYNLDIRHLKGTENVVADALSRV